ncbi:hypothetical protein ILUMI_06574 [Ignelater luminosus]|uniref:PiggyBac transposable element-derived protein domain-containing protein n=1 Tax=Ignelater luminosus TaxID=2038154 RepID=A0A8K0D513_IGNLU|nr:hypothetical protein ILUMI_06574 [Ignelater luminosus]
MEKKNLTLLGTIRKNKPEIPQELVTRGRDVYSTKFGYQDKTMLAFYCSKKGKIVALLLTVHDSSQISETEKKKPQMIIDYNKRMSGVDTMDKLVRTYTVKRQTKRLENKKGYKCRDFLMQLGKVLVVTGRNAKKASTSQSHLQETQKLKRGRCWKCPRNLDQKYSKRWQNCNRFACNVHQKITCYEYKSDDL